jgi:hypothetical protein
MFRARHSSTLRGGYASGRDPLAMRVVVIQATRHGCTWSTYPKECVSLIATTTSSGENHG